MNPQVLSHPMSVRLQRNAPDPLARQIWLRAWVFYITDSIRPSQQSLFSLVRMEDSLSEAFLCVPLGVEQAVVQTSIEPTTKSIFRKYQMWSSILYGDSFDFLFPLLGIKKKTLKFLEFWNSRINFWSFIHQIRDIYHQTHIYKQYVRASLRFKQTQECKAHCRWSIDIFRFRLIPWFQKTHLFC